MSQTPAHSVTMMGVPVCATYRIDKVAAPEAPHKYPAWGGQVIHKGNYKLKIKAMIKCCSKMTLLSKVQKSWTEI